jgi:hypothetical protein
LKIIKRLKKRVEFDRSKHFQNEKGKRNDKRIIPKDDE